MANKLAKATIKDHLHPHTWRILTHIDALAHKRVEDKKKLIKTLKAEQKLVEKSLPNVSLTVNLQSDHLTRLQAELSQSLTSSSFSTQKIQEVTSPSYKIELLSNRSMQDVVQDLCKTMLKGMYGGHRPTMSKWLEDVSTQLEHAQQVSLPLPRQSRHYQEWTDIAYLDMFVRTAYAMKSLLHSAPAYMNALKQEAYMQASTDLPLTEERADLAQECLEAARAEMERLTSVANDIEAWSDCFFKALGHVRLGESLLDGDPKLITKAWDRESLWAQESDIKMWAFMADRQWKTSLYQAALSARKDKQILTQALEDTSRTKPSFLQRKM